MGVRHVTEAGRPPGATGLGHMAGYLLHLVKSERTKVLRK